MSHDWKIDHNLTKKAKWVNDHGVNICKKCNTRKIVGIRQVYYVTSNPRAPSELEPDCDMIVAEQVMHS
jgi:hypothetical protein